jgi:hypothetical protein
MISDFGFGHGSCKKKMPEAMGRLEKPTPSSGKQPAPTPIAERRRLRQTIELPHCGDARRQLEAASNSSTRRQHLMARIVARTLRTAQTLGGYPVAFMSKMPGLGSLHRPATRHGSDSAAQSPLPTIIPTLLVGAAILAVTYVVWLATQHVQAAAPPATVTVVKTDVPAAPVSTLDRTYLSTEIANQADSRVTGLTVEVSIVGADGKAILKSQQRNIAIDGHDRRSIYWAWRVPDGVSPGKYHTAISVLSADGRVLGTSNGPGPAIAIVGRQ